MATEALTQDQLDQLHNWFSSGANTSGGTMGSWDLGNMNISATAGTTGANGVSMTGGQDYQPWNSTTNGYAVTDVNHQKPGDLTYDFDPTGTYTGSHAITEDHNWQNFLLSAAAMVGGAAAMGGTAGGAGATVGEGGFGTGAVGGTAGGAATDAAVGGAGSDIFGGNGMYTGFTDSGTAGGAADAAYAGGGTAGLGGTVTAADGTTALTPAATTAATTGATTAAGGSTLPAGATTAATTAAKVIAGSGGGTGGGTTGGGTTTGTGSGVTIGDIMKLIGGGVDYNNQNAAADKMLSYLQSRQQMNDNMYNPGSPEFNYLWNQMSRNDAAAGRNSQYGPRSVDLAARVAQLKMDANTKMTTGISNLMANAYNKQASAPAGLASTLANLAGGSSGSGSMTLDQLYKLLTSGGNASYGTNFDPSQFNDTNNPSNIGPTSADPSTYASDPNANNYSVDDQGLYF